MKCVVDRNTFEVAGGRMRHKARGWVTDELQLSVEYEVYGWGIYQGEPSCLIDPAGNFRPVWFSSDSFKIIDGSIPSGWCLRHSPESSFWTFLLGYALLIQSKEHFDGLLEREPKDIGLYEATVARQSAQEL